MTIGYYCVARGRLFDHPLFDTGKPLTEREAWLWLIENANFAPQKFRSGYQMFDVPRGSLATHYRSLAARWKWDHKRVKRFLTLLQNEAMVGLETPHQSVQISICNYDKYQPSCPTNAPRKPRSGPSNAPRMPTKIIKEEGKESISPTPHLPDWLPSQQWEGFREMRKKMKAALTCDAEKLAIAQLERLRTAGYDPKLVIEQSILKGWKSFYQLKGDQYETSSRNNQPSDKPNKAERAKAAVIAGLLEAQSLGNPR